MIAPVQYAAPAKVALPSHAGERLGLTVKHPATKTYAQNAEFATKKNR